MRMCKRWTARLPTRAGLVIPLERAAQAIKSWEQRAFGDVGLIQLVADFPLQLSRNDDASYEVRMRLQPFVHRRGRRRHQREERGLVQDARVERRRLEKHQKRIA